MPNDRDQRYDAVPPIPSYDEAMSNLNHADWPPPASPNPETELHGLLSSHNNAASSSSSSRRPTSYREPTVETDDEGSLFYSSDDGDETAYVRREMQELEMDDAGNARPSLWGKRIPFSLSLPNWKWSWRPRLPRLRRTVMLPQRPAPDPSTTTNDGGASTEQETARPRFQWPNLEGANGKHAAIILVRIFAGFLVMSFVYLIFMSDIFSTMARRFGTGLRFDPEDVRMWVQGHVENAAMLKTVKHYTSFAHIAGTEGDYGYAMDMETMFHRAGMDFVHIDQYDVYLNYPKANGRAVEILDEAGEKVTWKAKMEEKEVGGEIAGHQTFSFHGHSKAGDVKGPLVYANYGSREDFALLKDKEIITEGAIALVRYYGSQPNLALKVKAAQDAGFVGCLVYSDPEDDGFRQGDVAPAGRFMPEDGVQRGSVSLTNMVIGDVLTPGWGSKEGLPRMKVGQTPGLVWIPSLPLAWRDAQVLLQHLKGVGQKVPEEWKGGVPNVEEWWTGNASSPIVRLKNEQDEEKKQPIWNVYGKIEGIEQSEKTIMVGNHRDAWAFGATDPHTGTAIMMEVARLFGILLLKGWRPLRTIEFMSWDGEAYNMIGSTEFVETHADKLRENGCAYINLAGAVAGSELHASGSPVFQSVLKRILERIEDPHHNMTLRELWDKRGGKIEEPSVRGDSVPFLDIAGTSTLDLSFRGDPHPQYSSYDNFDWMKRIGDPGFVYHGLMAQVVAFLCLELADRPIMPFDMEAYGVKLDKWAEELTEWSKEKIKAAGQEKTFSIDPIKIAIHDVKSAAKTFSRWEKTWDSVVMGGGGWESSGMNTKRIEYNTRMAGFETALLDIEQGGGIPNRTQFKHVVFGPQAWSHTKQVTFPAIRDAIEDANWELAHKLVEKTSVLIRNAAKVLLDQQADEVPGR
ncbi:glutamate carboxypeptidase LAMP1 like protein [Verticillium longisporum]|nr:glutamate carboxypeptidase LAMP1 like protein [Verticillium longisporum]